MEYNTVGGDSSSDGRAGCPVTGGFEVLTRLHPSLCVLGRTPTLPRVNVSERSGGGQRGRGHTGQ